MKKAGVGVENLSMFNAYDILGLSVDFSLAPDVLEKRYLEVMQALHPDQNRTHAQTEQQTVVLAASQVNKAYQILKDPFLRAQHVWELKGGSTDSSSSSPFSPSSDFLQQSLEDREALEDACTLDHIDGLLHQALTRQSDLMSKISDDFEEAQWAQARQGIDHLAYLQKFIQRAQEKKWALEDERSGF